MLLRSCLIWLPFALLVLLAVLAIYGQEVRSAQDILQANESNQVAFQFHRARQILRQ